MLLNLRRSTARWMMFIGILALTTTPYSEVAAIDNRYDEQFYSSNSIYFYHPDAVSPCTVAPTVSSGTTTPGNDNLEKVLRFLTGQGMTLAQAAGMAGNMKQESGFNPAIIQGGRIADANYTPVNGAGFGLVQWTYTVRQQPLVRLAASMGKPVIDIDVQLAYIMQELRGSYKSTLQALAANPNFTPLQNAVIFHGKTGQSSGLTGDAKVAWNAAPRLGYEASADGPGGVMERGRDAELFYNQYRGKISDGKGIGGLSTSSADTVASSGQSGCGEYGSARVASNECSVSSPITGAGGSKTNSQLTSTALGRIYGNPTPSAMKSQLTSVNFNGRSVQIHKLAAGCLQAVANEIRQNNIQYTIREMGCYRFDSDNGGSNIGTRSYHTYGVACDINPSTNPFTKGVAKYDMPKGYVDAFRNHGWSWGGDWKSVKDYMHFEFNGIDPGGGGRYATGE